MYNFDETTAQSLHTILTKRKLELEDKLALAFPAWDKHCGYKRYKRDNKKRGIKAGVPVPVIKREIFNPNSRQHIADRLINVLGWKPKSFTPTGQPEVNEKVLSGLKYPEAKLISEYLMIQKRLGQLSDGDQAYLKLNKRGKIYGKVITNGQLQGGVRIIRQTLHNVFQATVHLVKNFVPYFILLPIWLLCGCDFSGLELRVLGHYLHNYDNGNFRKHYLPMIYIPKIKKLSGLSTRSKAKTFIYAFIYGCGDKKLGEILEVSDGEAKRVREKFTKSLPALATLIDAVKHKYRSHGYIKWFRW